MELKVIYGLVLVLLALGLFQLYKSRNLKENLEHNTSMPVKYKSQPGDNSAVYNINEREIIINEVIDTHTGEPTPSSSLKCNCWPLNNKGHNPAPNNNHKKPRHKHNMHPHKEEQDSSHHIPTHKGYTRQIHSRDPKTGLIEEKGPKGAEPYQLVSSFQ